MPKETFQWQQFIYWHQFWHSWKNSNRWFNIASVIKTWTQQQRLTVFTKMSRIAWKHATHSLQVVRVGWGGVDVALQNFPEVVQISIGHRHLPLNQQDVLFDDETRGRGEQDEMTHCACEGSLSSHWPWGAGVCVGYCRDGCFWSVWWGTDKTFLRVHIAHH